MLHNKRRKSKGEKRGDFKDLHARNAAMRRRSIDSGGWLFWIHFPVVICHFSFVILFVPRPSALLSLQATEMTNEKRQMTNGK